MSTAPGNLSIMPLCISTNIFADEKQCANTLCWHLHLCSEAVDAKVSRKLPKSLGEKSLRLLGTAEEAKRLSGYLVEQRSALSAFRVSNQ